MDTEHSHYKCRQDRTLTHKLYPPPEMPVWELEDFLDIIGSQESESDNVQSNDACRVHRACTLSTITEGVGE